MSWARRELLWWWSPGHVYAKLRVVGAVGGCLVAAKKGGYVGGYK